MSRTVRPRPRPLLEDTIKRWAAFVGRHAAERERRRERQRRVPRDGVVSAEPIGRKPVDPMQAPSVFFLVQRDDRLLWALLLILTMLTFKSQRM